MSFVANPFVVVLDASVLFPFRVRDALITFAQEGLFRARFTEEVLDERTRNLIALKPHLEESIRQQEEVIRREFDECFVTGHQPLIAGLSLPDKDDRHVLAAAIRCSAQVIVTENHKDFPPDVLDANVLETLGADARLANTFDLFLQRAARALRKMRKRYRNPAMTTSEFLFDLTKCGLSKLSAAARVEIEYL